MKWGNAGSPLTTQLILTLSLTLTLRTHQADAVEEASLHAEVLMEVEVSHVHWRWDGVELLPRRTADPGDVVPIGGRVHGSARESLK